MSIQPKVHRPTHNLKATFTDGDEYHEHDSKIPIGHRSHGIDHKPLNVSVRLRTSIPHVSQFALRQPYVHSRPQVSHKKKGSRPRHLTHKILALTCHGFHCHTCSFTEHGPLQSDVIFPIGWFKALTNDEDVICVAKHGKRWKCSGKFDG